jgi:hypothetical protein
MSEPSSREGRGNSIRIVVLVLLRRRLPIPSWIARRSISGHLLCDVWMARDVEVERREYIFS